MKSKMYAARLGVHDYARLLLIQSHCKATGLEVGDGSLSDVFRYCIRHLFVSLFPETQGRVDPEVIKIVKREVYLLKEEEDVPTE